MGSVETCYSDDYASTCMHGIQCYTVTAHSKEKNTQIQQYKPEKIKELTEHRHFTRTRCRPNMALLLFLIASFLGACIAVDILYI